MNEENVQKAYVMVEKAQILIKRATILVLLFFMSFTMLFDIGIFGQTISALNYIETTAEYVETKETDEDEILDEHVYTFKDKKGNTQEVIVDSSKSVSPEEKIMLKYNEKDPQDFYTEYSLMDTKEFVWFIGKLILIILLIVLFFNKKLLSAITISTGKRKRRR